MGKEFSYKQQYGVIAIVASEEEQRELYERLLAQGLTLKIVVV